MAAPAEVLIQLSAYLDGELDRAEAGRIAALLVSNPAVAEEHELLRQICDTLTRWDTIDSTGVAASPSFIPKLSERLRQLRADSSKSFKNPHSLTFAARN